MLSDILFLLAGIYLFVLFSISVPNLFKKYPFINSINGLIAAAVVVRIINLYLQARYG